MSEPEHKPRRAHGSLPFLYVRVLAAVDASLEYFDVLFIGEFGPFKRGETLSSVVLDLDDSELKETDDDGEVVRTCHFIIKRA